MDKNMTLEKRIAAELYCYQGKMSVFVDDLQGHTVEVGADEEFETASTTGACQGDRLLQEYHQPLYQRCKGNPDP